MVVVIDWFCLCNGEPCQYVQLIKEVKTSNLLFTDISRRWRGGVGEIFNFRSQNGWGWQGSLKATLSNLVTEIRSHRAGCLWLYSDGFWRSPKRLSTTFHSTGMGCPATFLVQNSSLMFGGTSCAPVCVQCPWSWQWEPLTRAWLCLVWTLPSYIYRY